jgi:hypothetical protein
LDRRGDNRRRSRSRSKGSRRRKRRRRRRRKSGRPFVTVKVIKMKASPRGSTEWRRERVKGGGGGG